MDAPCLHTIPNAVSYFATEPDQAMPAPPRTLLFAPRAAFAPPPGRLLLVCDLKQFELRMALHFAGDAALADALVGPSAAGDPMTLMAARWCRKAPADVSADERTWAKSIVYGLLYGKGTYSIAAENGIDPEAALKLVASFKASMQSVTDWLARVPAEARARQPEAFVQTLAGRRRPLPALHAQARACACALHARDGSHSC